MIGAGGAVLGLVVVFLVVAGVYVRVRRTLRLPDAGLAREAIGRVGTVVAAEGPVGRMLGAYRVRVTLAGGVVELVAHADAPLHVGDAVLVQVVSGRVAKVARAPRELVSDAPPPSSVGRDSRV